jgi:SAM-dependent methyltransferase
MDWPSTTWKSLPTQLARKIRRDGLGSTLARAWFLAGTRVLEWRYGIRTEAVIPWHQLSSDPNSVDYEATGYRTLRRAFHQIAVDRQDVFLDYGCGMGRPLIFAARRPFRRAIGVEMSPQLCQRARANLQTARGLRCRQVDVVQCAAEHYVLPDDVSVIFMFNPFRGQTLRAVIQQIESSLRRRPRPLSLLYLLPMAAEDLLARSNAFQVQCELPTEGLRLAVYRSRREATNP